MKAYFITYDIGSTGCKTCLYRLGTTLDLLASSFSEYAFTSLPNGGVEQDPEDWWRAMVEGTPAVLQASGLDPSAVAGISFCAQMQGLVLVDRELRPVRPAMSYMDQRAAASMKAIFGRGLRLEGVPVGKLLRSLAINGAVAASVKDPVWKYLWVRTHEPEAFARVNRWLDVKDYLIARATGRATMTRDSAFATFLTDERRTPSRWSPSLVRMYGVDPAHLPELVDATDRVGGILEASAGELGLRPGTPVYAGGGDAALIPLGAGSILPGDTHVYIGTSGWVSRVVERRKLDVDRHIASIVGAVPGLYHYFGEQETAGKCLQWVRDHLALDEINLYLQKIPVTDDRETRFKSLYDFLYHVIDQVPPGSGGVIFCPWLHGSRAPFEDPRARGIFFNLGLDTGKRMMIRAVVEGIMFHQRWLFEAIHDAFPIPGPVRFVGGGALSPSAAQILADILEVRVQTVQHPQNCGAAGAAVVAGVGHGLIPDFASAQDLIPVVTTYAPDPANFAVYRKHYATFKALYRANRPHFARLNSPTLSPKEAQP